MKDLNEKLVFSTGWNFDNSYTRLPSALFFKQNPVRVKEPHIVLFNYSLAKSIGLNTDDLYLLNDGESNIFSGNTIPEGADPIAQAYSGHQFGHFNTLGDGRAILLGEHITATGIRYDIQLKGSGVTPYSRRGDGRAALGPMIREYIISEAMHALGIPTTRSLAVVTTGEPVYRESILQGAILTRMASSHIRVGTFQFASSLHETETIRTLADYTLNRHFSELVNSDNKYLAFLNAIIDRQSDLIAKWMNVGFIHGVMNTDNMSICGETIDYGPCAFMDNYDPKTTFSSIDQQGRYAFGNQPHIAQWNLARFAETLLPLLHKDLKKSIQIAEDAIHAFPIKFEQSWISAMRAKLGLFTKEPEDLQLVEALLLCMEKYRMDYTNTFRDLASHSSINEPILNEPDFISWHSCWRKRLLKQNKTIDSAIQLMLTSSPAVIPRNYQVESAINAAEEGDFTVLERLLEALLDPFKDYPHLRQYRMPPAPSKIHYKTFCGT